AIGRAERVFPAVPGHGAVCLYFGILACSKQLSRCVSTNVPAGVLFLVGGGLHMGAGRIAGGLIGSCTVTIEFPDHDKQGNPSEVRQSLTTRSIVLPIVFSLLFYLLRIIHLPLWLVIAISVNAVFLPAYWIRPRPKIGFLRWAVVHESLLAGIIV